MAVVAATLANRGVCPSNGDRIFHSSTVTNCLAAMLHCGTYDSSGRFGRLVGLPAKSGVGGGIFVVVPGIMGICTFSPRLDKTGNSLRGLRFYESLLDLYALHMLELPSVVGDRKLDIRISDLRSQNQAIQEVVSAASRGDVDAIEQFKHDAGSTTVYRELLQAGDYDGRTALHLAASEGHEALVSYLIDKEVYPQPLDRWRQTPLADARRGGHAAIVNLLEDALKAKRLQVPAQPDIETETLEHGRQSRGRLLRHAPSRASTPEQLETIWAAGEGDLVTLRRHVARGNNLYTADYDDRTPLHLAAAQAHADVVAFLIDYHVTSVGGFSGSPDVEATVTRISWPDRWGRTPLDEALDPRILLTPTTNEKEIRASLPQCGRLLQEAGALTGTALHVQRLGQRE